MSNDRERAYVVRMTLSFRTQEEAECFKAQLRSLYEQSVEEPDPPEEPLSAAIRQRGHGRPNRFALFSDEELYALAEMTSSRTTSEGLSLHRRRMMGQVQLERQRRIETKTGESS